MERRKAMELIRLYTGLIMRAILKWMRSMGMESSQMIII
jgi:hypothetical protein